MSLILLLLYFAVHPTKLITSHSSYTSKMKLTNTKEFIVATLNDGTTRNIPFPTIQQMRETLAVIYHEDEFDNTTQLVFCSLEAEENVVHVYATRYLHRKLGIDISLLE